MRIAPPLAMLLLLCLPPFAQANCADQIASWEVVKPAQTRLLEELRNRRSYPWGTACPYGAFNESVLSLTRDFAKLSDANKREALKLLRLSVGNWPKEFLKDDEIKRLDNNGGAALQGAMSPVTVVDADGRTVSIPYDGCTRYTLLTEYDRYRYQCGMRRLQRLVRHPLSESRQAKVKEQFWKSVGKPCAGVFWISWVPECGYFEIDIDLQQEAAARKRLHRFLRVASQYKFVVVAQDASAGALVKGSLP